MLLSHEGPLTIIEIGLFLFLLAMDPEPTRHHFSVKPSGEYPNSDAFESDSFSKFTSKIQKKISKFEHSGSSFSFSPYQVAINLQALRKITANETIENLENFLFKPEEKNNFESKAIKSIQRYIKLKKEKNYFSFENYFFRPKNFSFYAKDRFFLYSVYGVSTYTFDPKESLKIQIESKIPKFKNELENVNFDENNLINDLILLQTSQFDLRNLYGFRPSKMAFFGFGEQNAMKNVNAATNSRLSVKFLNFKNSTKILSFPLQEKKFSLVFKWRNKTENDANCALCQEEDFLSAAELEKIIFEKSQTKKIIYPKFQLKSTKDFKQELKEIMKSENENFNDGNIFQGKNGFKTYFNGIVDPENNNLKVDKFISFIKVKVDENGVFSEIDDFENRSSTDDSWRDLEDLGTEGGIAVNRPFWFYVVDIEKRYILLSGKILNP